MNSTPAHTLPGRLQRALRPRRLAAGSAAVLAAAMVAGCSGGGPGVAAISQGQTITEQQIDDVMADFARAGAAGQIERAQVVALLALRPVLLEVAAGSGGLIGEDGVRQELEAQLPNPSAATVEFAQTQVIGSRLQSANMQALETAMRSADIVVSPAYGSYSPDQGFAPSAPNWIQAASATSPTPGE